MSNVKNQMSNVNKVKLLSERTAGVPPVIFFILKAYALTHRLCFQKLWTSSRWPQTGNSFHFLGLLSKAQQVMKLLFLVDLASYRFSIVFAPLKSDNTATILSWKLRCCIISIKIKVNGDSTGFGLRRRKLAIVQRPVRRSRGAPTTVSGQTLYFYDMRGSVSPEFVTKFGLKQQNCATFWGKA